jgi:3-oxoacyl-[acyl-carrier-protein] synthase II
MRLGPMEKKRVVITGMGTVSCFGSDISLFYENLLKGKSGVKPIESFACEEFPTRIAAYISDFDAGEYIDKKQARRLDPFISYSIVAGKKALEHAGITGDVDAALDKKRCGILVGSGMGGMTAFTNGIRNLYEKSYKKVSPFFIPYTISNMGGALLAIEVGFMGPNYNISTACATANHCIIAAAKHIQFGDADVMICGGTEASVTPIGLAGFCACKALSQNNENPNHASRPWDKQRDGFVMGEGAGVLVLESLEHAQRRGATIYGEYRGGAISCDAYHMTSPREDGEGVAMCIQQALDNAGLAPEDIDYISPHATSTPAGDMIEIRAMKKVFTNTSKIKINATKSMIGHTLGAAAGFEAIVIAKAIETGMLHPTLNLDTPDPEIEEFDVVKGEACKHDVNNAVSNSFGFGGHNASLILSKYSG